MNQKNTGSSRTKESAPAKVKKDPRPPYADKEALSPVHFHSPMLLAMRLAL